MPCDVPLAKRRRRPASTKAQPSPFKSKVVDLNPSALITSRRLEGTRSKREVAGASFMFPKEPFKTAEQRNQISRYSTYGSAWEDRRPFGPSI
jgi:hypothetical protein